MITDKVILAHAIRDLKVQALNPIISDAQIKKKQVLLATNGHSIY
jgi:hypothetical protein